MFPCEVIVLLSRARVDKDSPAISLKIEKAFPPLPCLNVQYASQRCARHRHQERLCRTSSFLELPMLFHTLC